VNNAAIHPTTHFQYLVSFCICFVKFQQRSCKPCGDGSEQSAIEKNDIKCSFFFIVLYFVSICRLAFDKCNNHPEPKGGLAHIMAGTMAVGRQQIITVGSSHQIMVMGS
jgi:hypothetical protein